MYQTVGIIKMGIILVIQNTLSLSSDQLSKLKEVSNTVSNLFSIQLDSIKTDSDRDNISNTLLDLKKDTNCTFFLFSSPETLQMPIWSKMIEKVVQNKTLSYVCVDEVHQFVHFATSFRTQFLNLKSVLFDKLLHASYSGTSPTTLKVPITFMSATFNKTLLELLQKITGYNFNNECMCWPGIDDFDRRNIQLSMTYSVQKFKVIKQALKTYLSNDNLERKCIIYSNVAKSVELIRDEIDQWLDNEGIVGDTILINGELEKEWKFVSTQTFTKSQNNDEINEGVTLNRFHSLSL